MIEKNTAIDLMVSTINNELVIFQDQFKGLMQIIDNINSTIIPGQQLLIISELSTSDIIISTSLIEKDLGIFSDLIVQRGKDILLLADQANQFICVSNDAFDRVIDTWNWLTSQDMELTITNLIDSLKLKVSELKVIINDRITLISDQNLIETQNIIDDGIKALREIVDTIVNSLSNISFIFKKSVDATSIFKNVLTVNTIVGIALAVTARAWDIMIRMNQHNYKTVTTSLDQLITTSTSQKFSTNELYPVSMIEKEKQINSWLNKILITHGTSHQIIIDGKIYKFINKKDSDYINETLPVSYNVLTTTQILENYNKSLQMHIIPDILLNIISKISLVQAIGIITPLQLTNWFNSLASPNFLLTDLLLELENPMFISWYNRYLNSTVLSETINNILLKKQKIQMRNILLEHDEISAYPDDIKIKNDTIYNLDGISLTSGTLAQVAFQQYLNAELIAKIDSSQYLGNLEVNKGLYKNKLIPETSSGQFTLAIYSLSNGEEKLIKILEQIKYSYILYKDDLKIHYMEAKINKDDYFLINDNKLQINYRYYENLPKDLTFIQTAEHQVQLLEQYHGFLVDFDYQLPTYDIINMNVNVVKIIEDKIQGIKKDIKINYNGIVDNNLAVITKTEDEVDKETHYMTDNIIERVTTDITNIYRTELINEKMDFTQARVNSIISTLRYLGYREELDKYIDDTWLYGVPRYVAQP